MSRFQAKSPSITLPTAALLVLATLCELAAVEAYAPACAAPPSVAAASDIVFTGRLQRATLPSTCQEESHYIECTSSIPGQQAGAVLVKSSTIDLVPFEGQTLRYTAVAAGVECLIFDITKVEAPPAHIEWCGTPASGCPLRFRVEPTGAVGAFTLWAGGAPAFLPIDPIAGTVLIGAPYIHLASGSSMGPEATVDLVVPGGASSAGIPIWVQGARFGTGPAGTWQFTDAVCFTLVFQPLPCQIPNC